MSFTALRFGSPVSSDVPAPLALPTLTVGADQQREDLALVTLTATVSGQDTLAWVLTEFSSAGVSSDQSVLLSSTSAASPTFTPRARGVTYVARCTATNGDGAVTGATVVTVTAEGLWIDVDLTAMTERDGPDVLTVGESTLTLSGNSAINTTSASAGARLTLELGVDVDDVLGIDVELTCTSYPVSGTGLRGLAVQVQDGTAQDAALGARAIWRWIQTDSRHAPDVAAAFASVAAQTDLAGTPTRMVASFRWGLNEGLSTREIYYAGAILYAADGDVVASAASLLRTPWSPDVVDPEAIVLELGTHNATSGALVFDGVSLRYRLVMA